MSEDGVIEEFRPVAVGGDQIGSTEDGFAADMLGRMGNAVIQKA
jgi:hypothetical protein